jgi:hypothetical protein
MQAPDMVQLGDPKRLADYLGGAMWFFEDQGFTNETQVGLFVAAFE